jgi:ABC-type branched-subunit amino acid transport system substrate-binding protein
MRVMRWCVPIVVVAMVGVSACSRSSSKSSSNNSSNTTASGSAASGDFGDLKGVCGSGNAKGATDKGVTDSSIQVGTMSDPGAQVQPGLNQELFDSATAFVAWCNAAGGILGRQLKLDKWDAALTEVSARMIQACQVDFSLVGNGEALDSSGVDQRVKCGLPEVSAYDVSAAAGTAPLSVQAIPTPDNQSRLGGAYRMLKVTDQAATQHYGLLNSQFQAIKDSGNRNRAAAKQLGYTETYYDELPLSVDNYRPYAQNLQTKGVQVFTYQGNPDQVAALLKSLADLGYHPKYAILDANHYDPKLIADAGPAVTGTKVLVNSYQWPFELANQNPATKQYIDLLAKYANGAKPKGLGMNAWSAWLLWAKAAKACGSNLTRKCMFDHANGVENWTGGGLHAPNKTGNASTPGSECFVLMEATPSGFVVNKDVLKPNKDGVYNCDPANVFDLKGFPQGS